MGDCACEGRSTVPLLSTASQDAGHTVAAAGVPHRFLLYCFLSSGGIPGEDGSLRFSQATQSACEAGI